MDAGAGCWWEYVRRLRVVDRKLLVAGWVDASTLLGPEGTGALALVNFGPPDPLRGSGS